MPNNEKPPEKTPEKTLGAVRDLLINPDGPPLYAMAVLGGPACSAAAMISQAAEETVGGIMANALGHTKFLDSRGMRDMLSGSDFSALDLNNGNTTVYFVLPPEYLTVHQRALRLVVNTFLAAAAKGRKGKHPTLYILDEFYSLGALNVMTRAAAMMRGYGVRIFWVVQNITQLIEMYPRNWETFFANAGQVQVFSVNDKAGAEYFSWRLGNRVKWRKRETQTNRGVKVEWEPAGASSLRDGIEVGRSTSRESGLQIVLNEGGDPFLLRRTPYDKLFKPGEYAPDPFEPRRRSLANRLFQKLRKVVS
jgi:type IV secretory pathway TraG/TraD family ATPase VirD4